VVPGEHSNLGLTDIHISIYIYVYICIHMYICIHVYVSLYIHRANECCVSKRKRSARGTRCALDIEAYVYMYISICIFIYMKYISMYLYIDIGLTSLPQDVR